MLMSELPQVLPPLLNPESYPQTCKTASEPGRSDASAGTWLEEGSRGLEMQAEA